ncbi:hypothetical protein E2C01_002863 [Portunus trituberculatus]|uniref:Uncharacterized protein n=1 Tax=Portunus trituberculatus TaxID=210409 RepID=A0A5B7CN22_PORTR|nr:hypothetical protein [Portunus trituberculatus]
MLFPSDGAQVAPSTVISVSATTTFRLCDIICVLPLPDLYDYHLLHHGERHPAILSLPPSHRSTNNGFRTFK